MALSQPSLNTWPPGGSSAIVIAMRRQIDKQLYAVNVAGKRVLTPQKRFFSVGTW